MSTATIDLLLEKLTAYKKKYYTNVLLRGSIFFLAALFSSWLLFSSLEYFGRFNTSVRIIFFFSFLGGVSFALYKWVVVPIVKLTDLKKQLSNEAAATQIGHYFPMVSDKLLNALQLRQISHQQNELLLASIHQKTAELSLVPFTEAINFKENKRYLKFLAVPVAIILLLLLFIPQMLTEGTSRIVHYNTAFIPQAPFVFNVTNSKLEAFRNEDFEVQLQMTGNTLPDQVYLISKSRRSKMLKNEKGIYTYTFRSLQRDEAFSFEAAGFTSLPYSIRVISRPDLRYFDAYLRYPSYLGKKSEALKNAGNLTLPEGTQIDWEFGTADAARMKLTFSSDEKTIVLESTNDVFKFSRKAIHTEVYKVQLENTQSTSKENSSYNIHVIKDEYPSINVEKYNDTVLYNHITLGGKISDDYGLRALKIYYRIKNKAQNDSKPFQSIALPLDVNSPAQSFYYNWTIDSLAINPGEALEYYVQVSDNDGVNGSKSSKSGIFEFKLPSQKEIEKARGYAESTRIKAEAEANANKAVALSISPALIDYERVKKWDGKNPTYVGGGSGGIIVQAK